MAVSKGSISEVVERSGKTSERTHKMIIYSEIISSYY